MEWKLIPFSGPSLSPFHRQQQQPPQPQPDPELQQRQHSSFGKQLGQEPAVPRLSSKASPKPWSQTQTRSPSGTATAPRRTISTPNSLTPTRSLQPESARPQSYHRRDTPGLNNSWKGNSSISDPPQERIPSGGHGVYWWLTLSPSVYGLEIVPYREAKTGFGYYTRF